MRILTRYLLREHLAPFVFALSAMTGLLLLNQVARQFPNLIGKGLPWHVIASVFGLSMPFILAMTLPMAVLMAVLQAFGRLASDSEITALKASGVHLVRLVRPVLVSAAVVGLVEFAFLDQILPRANHRLKNLIIDISRKKPTFQIAEQSVNELIPGQLFLRAGRVDQGASRMRDVVIYDLAAANRRRTVYADSGYLRLDEGGNDLHLTLFDGYIHDYDRTDKRSFRRIFFRADVIRVQGVSNQLQLTGENDMRGDREMTLCQMEARVAHELGDADAARRERRRLIARDALMLVGAPWAVDSMTVVADGPAARRTLTSLYCRGLRAIRHGVGPAELQADTVRQRRGIGRAAQVSRALLDSGRTAPPSIGTARAPAAAVVADVEGQQLRGQLRTADARQRSAVQRAVAFQVEIHKKYSLAVSCLVFVLIGAPVALRFPRGGVGLVIGASVAIFGIYYIGLIGGETLADALIVSPFAGMWAPNIVLGTVGLTLFLRLGRERATQRGGAWPEAFERWRARRRQRRA